MAKVVLEIILHGSHQYHRLENFPITVGRAFDNDIIVQDVTVSAHHLVITEEDGRLMIENLANENGTKLDGKKIEGRAEISLPAQLRISDIKARLLSSDMPVEATKVNNCSGMFCVFSSPVWAVLLLLATTVIFFVERYLITPVEKEPLYYLSSVLPSVWMVLGIVVVITGISRLSTYRWEIIPAISIASLIFLLPQLVEYLSHHLSYLFTSDTLGSWLKNTTKFLVIPALLAAFMVKTIHTRWLPALGVAVLVYSPFLAYQLLGVIDEITTKSGFSEVPVYSQTLLPNDYRLNTTLSLDDFVKEAEKITSEQVKEMLTKAKEEDSRS